MLKDDKEWTVSKLHQLLGKHISAVDMAIAWNFQRHPLNASITQASQNDNSRRNHFVLEPTTSGLLAGNAKYHGPRQS